MHKTFDFLSTTAYAAYISWFDLWVYVCCSKVTNTLKPLLTTL